ncbi:hypothetical protein C7N43_20400 [Sphingobacteriales bacterium UPWRP_1]|nr:hypothetical protein BVG80_01970 [Sphingobacteriales bacterium TSM_CSM]PSJ75128.1 hypothetical protein C7N43_20400 [Sphingobacteriales bacterium UPWRP_1]
MNKFIYYLLFLVNCLIVALVARITYVDIAVYKKGTIIKAEIEKVICYRRNSSLDLNYLNSNHVIMISYGDCINGVYQIGDSITVKALPQYRRTQFPNSHEFVSGLIALIFFSFTMVYWIVAKNEVLKYLSGKGNSKSG